MVRWYLSMLVRIERRYQVLHRGYKHPFLRYTASRPRTPSPMDSDPQPGLSPVLVASLKEALACGLIGVVVSAGYVELNLPPGPPLRCRTPISLSDHPGYMVLPFCKPTYTFGTTLGIL